MSVPPLVINRCPRPDNFHQLFFVKNLPRFGISPDALRQIKNIPPVAVCHIFHKFAGFFVNRQFHPFFALGSLQQLLKIFRRQTVQYKNLTSGQQSRIQLKRWILGSCADQNNRSVLHIRQKTVLLRFVKAMDFINKQQSPLALGYFALLRILKDPL